MHLFILVIGNILLYFVTKVDPEHFVFSTFGVLHVIPGGSNETQSLAEWMKEAVLYRAVSCLPFFKNFLIKKSFDKYVIHVCRKISVC